MVTSIGHIKLTKSLTLNGTYKMTTISKWADFMSNNYLENGILCTNYVL